MATFRKRGRKWHVQVRRQGHPALTKSFIQRVDAETWARQIEAQLDRGEAPVLPKPKLGLPTLRSLLERYRDTVIPHKRSREKEASALLVFLREPICDLSLDSIGPEHFTEYRDRRLLTVKPATVCRTLAIVQHAFETAINEWRLPIKTNPVKAVTRPRLNNQRVRRVRQEEIQAIEAGLTKTKNPWIALAIALAIETGMRRSEMLGLKWVNIDLDEGVAFLPMTKNGLPRAVPLSPRAVEILRSIKRTDGEARVLPLTTNALRLAWERLRRRAGLEDLRLHDFRHEAVSRFFEIGLAMPEVALISGHRDARMLMRYTHVSAQAVAEKLRSCSATSNSSSKPSGVVRSRRA